MKKKRTKKKRLAKVYRFSAFCIYYYDKQKKKAKKNIIVHSFKILTLIDFITRRYIENDKNDI
jgi:hypothetical protein